MSEETKQGDQSAGAFGVPSAYCSECSGRFKFRVGISASGAGVVGPEWEDRFSGGGLLTTPFCCPHCNAAIRVVLDVKIVRVELAPEPPAPKAQRVAEVVHPSRKAAMERLSGHLESTGLLPAFTQALQVAYAGDQPKSIADMLDGFLQRAAQMPKVPSFVLNEFRRLFPNGFITFWADQQIVAVKSGAQIVWFVPRDYIVGRKTKSLLTAGASGNGIKMRAQPEKIVEWVRTRNGYVLGRGALFQELSGRRPGQFAGPLSAKD